MAAVRPVKRSRAECYDIAATHFGEDIAPVTKLLEKKKISPGGLSYGPLRAYPALLAHKYEGALHDSVGTEQFPVNQKAHDLFIHSLSDPVSEFFLKTRQLNFEKIHAKVLSGELPPQGASEQMKKASARHLRAFNHMSAALDEKNLLEVDKWRKAIDLAHDRDEYHRATR